MWSNRLLPLITILAVLAIACLRVPEDITIHVGNPYFNYAPACGLYSSPGNIYLNPDCFIAENTPRPRTLYHEMCHAHQDLIAGEEDLTFWKWEESREGKSYTLAIGGEPRMSTRGVREDFAAMCARYYTDRDNFAAFPQRFQWAEDNLPPLPPKVPDSDLWIYRENK